jgi:hypothetical protein
MTCVLSDRIVFSVVVAFGFAFLLWVRAFAAENMPDPPGVRAAYAIVRGLFLA